MAELLVGFGLICIAILAYSGIACLIHHIQTAIRRREAEWDRKHGL